MNEEEIRRLIEGFRTIESVAVLDRARSTNDIARRVVNECIENEIGLPSAVIVAREQTAGRGRGSRSWYSPPGAGIYATALHSRPVTELAQLPLEVATIVASFLRDVYRIEARIKWPNDVVIGERKVAGILIEARVHGAQAYLLIGIGVNVQPLGEEAPPGTISIAEASALDRIDLDSATDAFLEFLDARLAHPPGRGHVLEEWRALSVHRTGDRISCVVGDRTVSGTWGGIDDDGRALIRSGETTTAVSAGDLVLV